MIFYMHLFLTKFVSIINTKCMLKNLNFTFFFTYKTNGKLSVFFFVLTAEFLFLLWGVYLCYAVRTVPSAFHEPRYMAVAVHNELIISAIFHTIRQVICRASK